MPQLNYDPAISAAGWVVPAMTLKALNKTAAQPDQFERLPVNLSSDEIRAMVLEVLG